MSPETSSTTIEFRGVGWGWLLPLLALSPFIVGIVYSNPNPTQEELLQGLLFPFFYWLYWRMAYDLLPKRVTLTSTGIEYRLCGLKRFEATWDELVSVRSVNFSTEHWPDHSFPSSFISFNRLVLRAEKGWSSRKLVLTDMDHFRVRELKRLMSSLVWVKEHYDLKFLVDDRAAWALGTGPSQKISEVGRAARRPQEWQAETVTPASKESFVIRRSPGVLEMSCVTIWVLLVFSRSHDLSSLPSAPGLNLLALLTILCLLLQRCLIISPQGVEYRFWFFRRFKLSWKEITELRIFREMTCAIWIKLWLAYWTPAHLSIKASIHSRSKEFRFPWSSFSKRKLEKIFLVLVREGRIHNPDIWVRDELGWLEGKKGLALGPREGAKHE